MRAAESMRSHRKTIYEALGREPVHPFPARMAPGIALDAMRHCRAPLRVLDPMAGSGTVLAMARSSGHRAIGLDVDPLAVLISQVWTTAIDRSEVTAIAEIVLRRARHAFAKLSSADAYPLNATEETRGFVSYWFDPYARRQLTSLAREIARIASAEVRNALWCAFSRLIIAKQSGASRARDLSHSRPHRAFAHAPTKPFNVFAAAVERVVTNCIDRQSDRRGPAASVREGDARDLPLRTASIDLVITSPPYLNAIDYLRCSKFSLVWMGYSVEDLRALRTTSVGTEAGGKSSTDPDVRSILRDLRARPALEPRQAAILSRYVADMLQAIREVGRVLIPGGRAIYVVGENTLRGTYVRNATLVEAAADFAGLRLSDRRSRALPANRRYMPPPATRSGATMDARMRREVVLTFVRRPI